MTSPRPTCVRLTADHRAVLTEMSALTGKNISDLIRDAVVRDIAAFRAGQAVYATAMLGMVPKSTEREFVESSQ